MLCAICQVFTPASSDGHTCDVSQERGVISVVLELPEKAQKLYYQNTFLLDHNARMSSQDGNNGKQHLNTDAMEDGICGSPIASGLDFDPSTSVDQAGQGPRDNFKQHNGANPIDDKSIFQRAYELIDRTSRRIRHPSSLSGQGMDGQGGEGSQFESNRLTPAVARAQAKAASAYVGSNSDAKHKWCRSLEPGAEHVSSRAPGLSPTFYLRLIRRDHARMAQEAAPQAAQQGSAAGDATELPALSAQEHIEVYRNHDNLGETEINVPTTPVEAIPTAAVTIMEHTRRTPGWLNFPATTMLNWIQVVVSLRKKLIDRWNPPAIITLACGVSLLIISAIVLGVVLGADKTGSPSNETTFFDPYTFDCSLMASQANPHVITQCHCTGAIFHVAADIANHYEVLLQTLTSSIFPNNAYILQSCFVHNQALVWLASGDGATLVGTSTSEMLQRYVLAMLFMIWNGPNWRLTDSTWLTAQEECTWIGISCTQKVEQNYIQPIYVASAVSGISLAQLNLNGLTIPSEIGLLTNLENLDLSHTALIGTIPTDLFHATSLQLLDLQENSLSGTIPTQIGQLVQLGKGNCSYSPLPPASHKPISHLFGSPRA